MTLFTNGACAVRERIPVRMLQITPQIVNAFNVNVIYVQPYSQTTYANDIKFSKFDAGTTSILNVGYPSYRGVPLRRKKPNVNDVKKCAGRTYVSELAYLPNLHIQRVNIRKRHLASSVNMQLRYDGVRDLRLSDLREIYA